MNQKTAPIVKEILEAWEEAEHYEVSIVPVNSEETLAVHVRWRGDVPGLWFRRLGRYAQDFGQYRATLVEGKIEVWIF